MCAAVPDSGRSGGFVLLFDSIAPSFLQKITFCEDNEVVFDEQRDVLVADKPRNGVKVRLGIHYILLPPLQYVEGETGIHNAYAAHFSGSLIQSGRLYPHRGKRAKEQPQPSACVMRRGNTRV